MTSAKWLKISHRGTPKEFPDNTLKGFQRACELGCLMLECDIRLSADGELALAHDDSVTDSAGNRFLLPETPYAVLKSLDLGGGEGVPTLQDLVRLTQGHLQIMADMKVEGGGVEAKVVEALAPLPYSHKIISGASLESRTRFQEIDPHLSRSLTLDRTCDPLFALPDILDQLRAQQVHAVTAEHPLLNPERVQMFHNEGLRVYAWTVDALPTMHALIAMGVDGIISNRPDLLAELA